MSPHQTRGRARSRTGARGARVACGTHGNHEEGNDDNYQESVMRGVESALPVVFGDAKFMQGVFIAIEQVVRNTVQTIQVPIRAVDSRATTAMKAFLQLRPPTFRDEPDPLDAEDWLKQVTKALDTILVMEEELRCCLRHTNCKGTHSNGGRPWRKVWLKSVNHLRKPF